MRIVLVAPPWVPVPPPAYGGTENVLDALARGLVSAGHEVMLVTTGESTCPVPRRSTFEKAVGVGLGGSAAEMRHVLFAYEQARAWGADVVHDHTLCGPVWAYRYPELPVVTTNHGPFDSDLGHLYRAIQDEVSVIAISHHQASTATGIRVAAVIHHGVDASDFPVGGGGDHAVFLGRMSPDKGVHVAVEAARRAGMPLLVAAKMSEPHERDYFEARVRPLLGGNIEYVGEVGGAEKAALLGGAACLLNPIAWPEPFGMVMVEALACGTPVIATPQGAAPEIVDEGVTGHIRGDIDGLVQALTVVGELDRGDCREALETRFSAARMATDHERLYRSLLGVPLHRPSRAA